MDQEKVVDSHIDNIEQVGHDSSNGVNADDRIIRDLETHGEEVGLTFRTVMAAVVGFICEAIHTLLIVEKGHGFLLQCIPLYSPYTTRGALPYQRRPRS